jgi:hypothetical protein
MRPRRSSRAVLLLALALLPGRLPAQVPGAIEGGAFLLLPVGARATALGQAAVADGGSTEALFWNPAGLADLRTSEFALHHYAAFFGAGDALVIAVPTAALGVFTVGAYVVDYGDLDVTAPGSSTPIGRVTPRNVALSASYAAQLAGGLSAGITYKLIQFRVDCSGDCSAVPTAIGTTHALDIGVRFVGAGDGGLVVGAVIRNLGFKLQVNNEAQADPLPTRVAVGAAWVVTRPKVGTEGFDVRVLADVSTPVGAGTANAGTVIGVESGVRDIVRLRFGWSFLEASNRGPSVGVGLKLGRMGFDLARTFYATDLAGEQEPFHVSFRVDF